MDAHELMAAADAWQKLQKESAFMKKLLLAACIVMILMFAGMFVMGLVTAEMAKEFKAGGSGGDPRMTSKSGDTIQVPPRDSQLQLLYNKQLALNQIPICCSIVACLVFCSHCSFYMFLYFIFVVC